MALAKFRGTQKAIDRALLERQLIRQMASDLPKFYEKLASIALEGEDTSALRAITYVIDRCLGPAKQDAPPASQPVINIINSVGGSIDDYRLERHRASVGSAPVVVTAGTEDVSPS